MVGEIGLERFVIYPALDSQNVYWCYHKKGSKELNSMLRKHGITNDKKVKI